MKGGDLLRPRYVLTLKGVCTPVNWSEHGEIPYFFYESPFNQNNDNILWWYLSRKIWLYL